MTKTSKDHFEALMHEKIENDYHKENPDEGMSKISFRIPTGGLNTLDYMAKTLDTTRQDILNQILQHEIKEAYIGMTQHLQMEPKEWGIHFEKVCSGELKDGHNA